MKPQDENHNNKVTVQCQVLLVFRQYQQLEAKRLETETYAVYNC